MLVHADLAVLRTGALHANTGLKKQILTNSATVFIQDFLVGGLNGRKELLYLRLGSIQLLLDKLVIVI